MSIYTAGLRKRPTYEELIGEIQTDYKVTMPNRDYTFLRNSHAMSFLDEESYAEMEDQTIARNKHLRAEQVIQQQASQGGGTASMLRATQAPPPPPPQPEPSASSSASASASASSKDGTWINQLGNWITRDEANKKAKARNFELLLKDTGNVVPMEVEDLAQLTSNPAQKRSMVDPDPNYGNVIAQSKPKGTPLKAPPPKASQQQPPPAAQTPIPPFVKPIAKPSPKAKPSASPTLSSSASASASAATVALEPASPAIKANILASSAGSTKDKTYKARHWQDMNIEALHAKVKQLGIYLTDEQLSHTDKGRYPKAKLVTIIMNKLNKS